MKMNENCSPQGLYCNAIWELYKLLETLDKRYLLFYSYNRVGQHKELYYLEEVNIG